MNNGPLTLLGKILQNYGLQLPKASCTVELPISFWLMDPINGSLIIDQIREKYITICKPTFTYFTIDFKSKKGNEHLVKCQQKCRNFCRERSLNLIDQNIGLSPFVQLYSRRLKAGQICVSTIDQISLTGSVGCLPLKLSAHSISYSLGTGKIWWKVPKQCQVRIKLAKNAVVNQDLTNLTIFIANKIQEHLGEECDHFLIELSGDCLDNFTNEQRFSLCGITQMISCVGVILPINEKSFKKNQQIISSDPKKLMFADPNAKYDSQMEINFVSTQAWGCSLHSCGGNFRHKNQLLQTLKGKKVGTCYLIANSNTIKHFVSLFQEFGSDLKIKKYVSLFVIPETIQDYQRCIQNGSLQILLEMGANVMSPSIILFGLNNKFDISTENEKNKKEQEKEIVEEKKNLVEKEEFLNLYAGNYSPNWLLKVLWCSLETISNAVIMGKL
ncbi:methanogen homoaconitase large subunit [Anaeramoeba flamelloides]|uniref:Methanogen homoaconitase large subunit n=1 Tax=Anaeramoeba flamelloides TaxID=1746091 RepID=A0AAV7YI34_9EUKA|nr:methanogen homoaconitase large subunit [Anaeramoeba flamelloides]